MIEISGLILDPGKQGSLRNSGLFEITEFEIADSNSVNDWKSKAKSKEIRSHLDITGTSN